MIRSGFEPETYCLEGSCSIQLSYGTDLILLISQDIGCKVREFFGNSQISDGKSYIRAVIEGIIALYEGLCGLEFTNVQRVVATLFIEECLGLCKGRSQMRITVAGQHNLPGSEVEGDDGHLILWDGEPVDNGIGLVLVTHHLEHRGDHHLARWVVGLEERLLGHALCQEFAHLLGAHLGQGLLVGLGIIHIFATNQSVAIAHEPYLPSQTTIEDDGGAEALLRMLGHPTDGETPAVVATDHLRGIKTELTTRSVGRHLTDIAADEQHGITPVAHEGTMVAWRLRCGAVDHGDKVICDDDSVLAFLRGTLRNDALLDYFHS